MKRPPTVSVAISTRDRPDALDRCLATLLGVGHAPQEVVIVDQSTTDDTRLTVDRHRSKGSELVYVAHDASGLAASQNEAIRRAGGEIVAVLDDDCVPDAEWLPRIEATFQDVPDLGLLTGRVLPLGPPQPDLYPVSSRTRTTPTDFHGPAPPWEVGSGNNFAVRKEAFLRIGGCDERLGPGSPGKGGVDMDLFYRLLRSGTRGRYEPSVLVYHEQMPYSERSARRPLYGYGTGACFALWLREGDPRGLSLGAHWLGWRAWRMIGALTRGDRTLAHEEATMLRWTFPGFWYGLRAPTT